MPTSKRNLWDCQNCHKCQNCQKLKTSNTAWPSHNQNTPRRHGGTEARRKASRELTRMTAEFTRMVWEINVKDKPGERRRTLRRFEPQRTRRTQRKDLEIL